MPSPRRRKNVTSDPDRAPRAGGGSRRSVTSDPDHGVAVNSATDPQRPGASTRRPAPDTAPPGTSAQETSVGGDRFGATHQPPKSGRLDDVEREGGGGSDDAL